MKKRILFVNGHMKTGGVEKSLADILAHLDYEKYEVDLLLLEDLGNYIDAVPSSVHVMYRNIQPAYGPFFLTLKKCIANRNWVCFKIRLLLLLRKFNLDVYPMIVHLLTDKTHYNVAIAYRTGLCGEIVSFGVKAEKKYLWWHHGEVNLTDEQILNLKSILGNIDETVAVSDSCADILQHKIQETHFKPIVISNMVDVDEIQTKSQLFFPYEKTSERIIVSVSRIAPEKHFENVVFAVQRLIQDGICNFKWYIVGGDWDYEKICRLIEHHGLSDYIIMEGNQPNPYPYLKNADLFVHPSYVESQGLVVLEAMALGIPCVVTKSLGPCEFIEDGVNGILTEQNPESLTEKVLEMLTNRELYEHIRANTRCPEQFAPERVMAKIEELLEK